MLKKTRNDRIPNIFPEWIININIYIKKKRVYSYCDNQTVMETGGTLEESMKDGS